MKDILIALDQGSGSSRAMALDAKGRVVAKAQYPLRTFYPRPGWVEHDPEDLRRSQERALDLVLSKLSESANVLGLGVSCQRSTFILWDAKTGRPLARAPSWQDGRAYAVIQGSQSSRREGGRAASFLERLQSRQQEIHDKTGLYANPYYSALKLSWFLENDPKVRHAADRGVLRAGPVASYLLWHWTRGQVFAADPSLAQRMLLFNIRTLDWDPDLLSAFGVSQEWLPEILPSTGSWGEMERKGRKIPILAVLGDQQAAALSLGADLPGAGMINYGTGAFFLLNVGAEDRRVPGLLTSVGWQNPGKSCNYFLEGTVHAAGTSFEWLKQLGVLKDMKKVEFACRKSTQRLFALMAIGGLGAPRWDYSTSTAFSGMNSKTRPEDLVRAVTEGIAFLIADIVSAIRGAGLSIDSIRAAGGLSHLDYLLQFQANILRSSISRTRESEATAIGVAALTARQAGLVLPSGFQPGRSTREFKPRISSVEAEKLLAGWKLFVETQQKLSVELCRKGILS